MTEMTNENLESQELTENAEPQPEVTAITEDLTSEEPIIEETITEEPVIEKPVKSKLKVERPVTEPEFDWSVLESGLDAYTIKRRDELEKLYNNTLNTVQEKEVQEGTVISMNKREVVIDIGYKSDGIVSRWVVNHMIVIKDKNKTILNSGNFIEQSRQNYFY